MEGILKGAKPTT